MNNEHKITPATPLKLSSGQINQLLINHDIVDADSEQTKTFLAGNGELDNTGSLMFYPYDVLLDKNTCRYLVHEETIDHIFTELWEQFEQSAIKNSQKLAYDFENRLDLELPARRLELFSESIGVARKTLSQSKAILPEESGVLLSFKNVILKFITENVEHALSLWSEQQLKLEIKLQQYTEDLALYYFIQYLKWRSLSPLDDALALGKPYHEILSDILEPKLASNSITFNEELPDRLTQREIILLLTFSDEKWLYLKHISNTKEIRGQFFGLLTGYKPTSFARELSRTLNIGGPGGGFDKKYLDNLVKKLSDKKLSSGSLIAFAPIIKLINKCLIDNKL